jgi:hypothetical protein
MKNTLQLKIGHGVTDTLKIMSKVYVLVTVDQVPLKDYRFNTLFYWFDIMSPASIDFATYRDCHVFQFQCKMPVHVAKRIVKFHCDVTATNQAAGQCCALQDDFQ